MFVDRLIYVCGERGDMGYMRMGVEKKEEEAEEG